MGIDQLFPVLPLEGLDQVPERRAVLLDITCDSDGAIDHYIDGDGIATTMPMPEYDPENPPMLGFFMVGAYQEILGNMHNLFGDTEAVDVFVFPDGSVEVELSDEGDTVADMLQYVQLDPKTLLTQFRDPKPILMLNCNNSSWKSSRQVCTVIPILKMNN